MSHFLAYVLAPSSGIADKPESYVEPLLAPYSENLEVAPYKTECYCVGGIAKRDAFNTAGGKKKLDALRNEYFKLTEENRPEWKDFIEEFLDAEDAALKSHPLYNKPDITCDECHGTGKRETTYNPESKWDKFQIGGRWTGLLQELATSSRRKKYKGDIHDVATILANWKDDFTPYTIVTPDGKWHERRAFDRRGTFPSELSVWMSEAKAILTTYSSCIAIVVDCHI